MKPFPFKRIVVVGTTSSGKSTLAKNLADIFRMDFIELDALHWKPNWIEMPHEIFRARVDEGMRAECWALAGNYGDVRDIIWPRAEAAIWLDYPLRTLLWQLTRRTLMRWWRNELLWGTNRENILRHFKFWSGESLYHWLFKTYWRRKREYPQLFSEPRYAHLTLFRLGSPREAEEWLAGFQEGQIN